MKVLIADSQEKLQDIFAAVEEASVAKGLTISVDETAVVVVSSMKAQAPRCSVRINKINR